jgi:hypothetical protein
MPEDPRQFERQLDELEQSINLLKREFEKYFGGGARKPPTDDQARLDKAIKRYAGASGLNYAQRFRYNSLVARFNSYNELWNKQLRLKEEGKFQTGNPNQPPPHAPKTHHTERPKDNPMEKVYNDYLSARTKTGEGQPQMNLDGFSQLLAKQREALISKFHCKDVQFYVTVEDGKTKLKAKPQK